jgi:hypothetical protein
MDRKRAKTCRIFTFSGANENCHKLYLVTITGANLQNASAIYPSYDAGNQNIDYYIYYKSSAVVQYLVNAKSGQTNSFEMLVRTDGTTGSVTINNVSLDKVGLIAGGAGGAIGNIENSGCSTTLGFGGGTSGSNATITNCATWNATSNGGSATAGGSFAQSGSSYSGISGANGKIVAGGSGARAGGGGGLYGGASAGIIAAGGSGYVGAVASGNGITAQTIAGNNPIPDPNALGKSTAANLSGKWSNGYVKITQLIAYAVPDAPTDLEASPNYGSVDLNWTAPQNTGNQPITGYTIEYQEQGSSGSWSSIIQSGAATTANIPNLDESKIYVFRIYAVNQIGTSASYAETTSRPFYIAMSAPTTISILDLSPSEGTRAVSEPLIVTTNHTPGYVLVLSSSDPTLYCSQNNANTLQTLATDTAFSSFPDDRYGLAISATSDAPGTFKSVTTSTSNVFHTQTSFPAENTFTNYLHLAAKVSAATPACKNGKYTGTVTITAVAEP